MKIALVANTSWYIYNFRRNLMRVLQNAGHTVVAIAPPDAYSSKLGMEGFRHRSIPMAASGLNPVNELRSVLAIHHVFRSERADLVLSFTPKGNIYSGLAAMMLPTRQIANISGLGRTSIHRGFLTSIVSTLYRIALSRSVRTFFQNNDDRDTFIHLKIVSPTTSERIPGSGVDLCHFSSDAPLASSRESAVFLLIARLLWDKGVGEFVEAARRIRAQDNRGRFQILGAIGSDNPSSVPRAVVEGWVAEGLVEYLGTTDDVRPYIEKADCVVLPSYREGVPRSLLEAAAMAKPLIAADSVGCRDAVDDGLSGYLCRSRDAADLAAKMAAFLDMSTPARRAMGQAGRQKMEREFDENAVIARYMDVIEGLSNQPPAPSAWR